MVVQELCRQLPTIDFQNTAQLLAVGVPGALLLLAAPSTLSMERMLAKQTIFRCTNAATRIVEVSSRLYGHSHGAQGCKSPLAAPPLGWRVLQGWPTPLSRPGAPHCCMTCKAAHSAYTW